MAIDRKYGKVDVPGVPDDEPVFILRAQDVCSERAIVDYALEALRVGASPEHAVHALRTVADMAKWPKKKVPDTTAAR